MMTSPIPGLGKRLLKFWSDGAEVEYQGGVLKLLEHHPTARFLDCGCGDGEFAQAMAEKIGTADVNGIDVVTEKIEASGRRGIKVFQGDLNRKLPFPDASFDAITAVQVIEHLTNTDLFVCELYRILRTGGYAIVVTPNLASIHNIMYLFLGKQPVTASVSDEFLVGTCYPGEKVLDAVHKQPSHQRVFTLGALKGLLEHHGFEVEKAMGTSFFPLPGSLARVAARVDGRHAIHLLVKARKHR